MMRIGVISDSHGSDYAIGQALRALPDVDAWIHLGDTTADARALAAKVDVPVHFVRGNCDFDPTTKGEDVLELEGIRILICHGHLYGVRYSRTKLFYRAEELRCSIALYGHTHVSLLEASGPVLALNPGSPTSPREGRAPSVALVKIEDGQVYPEIVLV